MFIRNEPFRFFIKLYPITAAILAINTAIYLLLFVCSIHGIAPEYAYKVFQLLIGSNAAIQQGAWWQFITPIFLHVTFSHYLFNAFTIFIFAPALEGLLGKTRFIAAYLGTGVISNIFGFLLEPTGFSHYGASSAIFGLFGVYLFLIIFHRHLIPKQDQTIIIVFLVIDLISTFVYQNIDIMGHFTGFLAGLLLAPLLLARQRLAKK
ncbi:MAG: rhomboid family intramembrane serine protease [Sporolactobacillus sp.]